MVGPPERTQDDAATPDAELVKVATPSPGASDININNRFVRGADRSGAAGEAMELTKGARMREVAEAHVSHMHCLLLFLKVVCVTFVGKRMVEANIRVLYKSMIVVVQEYK